jgi:hypothetical protein
MLHKDYDHKDSVEEKSLVVILKGLDAETNWLAVSRHSESNFYFDFDFWRLSVEFRDASLPGYELGSRGIESRNWGITIIELSSIATGRPACEEKTLREL